jgi:hypothetical protein
MSTLVPTPEVVFSGVVITIMVLVAVAALVDLFGPRDK